jgi:hypothetical protein
VVVVQLHGSKRWRLWGMTREAPTFRDVESPEEPEGDPVADLVLSPGDVLYLPRGWWHSVTADQGTESLHLTFGMVPHTGADLMLWVVDQLRASLALRRDIPRFCSLAEQSDFTDAVRREVADMMADPRLVERWAESIDTTDLGHAIPSLPYVDGLPARGEITVKLTTPRGRLTANREQGTVTFSAAGTAYDFAESAAPALGTLLTNQPTTLGELADVAARIRMEFAAVLDTPAGRIGELAALAEMLQAVARGWYPDLAPRLVARAEALTGVRPPVPVHSEVSA